MNGQPLHRYVASLILVTALFTLACAFTDIPAPTPTAVAFPTVALPNTASTFDYNSLVGQSASAFALTDANGQAYTFTPNDGRKHVIVFYMFYG